MKRQSKLAAIYAAFLGKVIGVRLGAPVENWTAEQIRETYPVIDGYLVDYGVFAADDDTNGPYFFARALDGGVANADLPRAVANAMLDYVPNGNGFFWWGGVNVSTEHTAYHNLSHGLPAPYSGSMNINGRTLAEQIGGQIFSDCWGVLSLGNPALAADRAASAASVTHDGDGIEGARFIAACIAIAANETDAVMVVKKALAYLTPDGGYARMVRDILDFYEAQPCDAWACFTYIQTHYTPEQYGGVCHILPNAARIVLALCYGKNNFTDTLTLLCKCGWDTDCNCGNAGSIMGALCGLDGIEEKWIAPINDVLIYSSCVGFLNNGTVSGAARMFARLSSRLRADARAFAYRFMLPYETNGFCAEGGALTQKDDALFLNLESAEGKLYRIAYYRPGEVYDARYEPMLSPLAYAGETIRMTLSSDRPVLCTAYAETDGLRQTLAAPVTVCSPETVSVAIPSNAGTVLRFGIQIKSCDGSPAAVRLHRVLFNRHADAEIDFSKLAADDYGPKFAGGSHRVLRGFTEHSGVWTVSGGQLLGKVLGRAIITTGDTGFDLRSLSAVLQTASGCGAYLLFGFRGAEHYCAAGVRDGQLTLLSRHAGKEQRLLAKPLEIAPGADVTLKIALCRNEIRIQANEKRFFLRLRNLPSARRGAVGLLVTGKGQAAFRSLSFRA